MASFCAQFVQPPLRKKRFIPWRSSQDNFEAIKSWWWRGLKLLFTTARALKSSLINTCKIAGRSQERRSSKLRQIRSGGTLNLDSNFIVNWKVGDPSGCWCLACRGKLQYQVYIIILFFLVLDQVTYLISKSHWWVEESHKIRTQYLVVPRQNFSEYENGNEGNLPCASALLAGKSFL